MGEADGVPGRSAIKKVCRRHGIIRWPHRKLLGADKALAVLASKVASTTADPVARAAWQTEAVNILVAKLRLTLDPKYLSDWVQLDPVVGSGPAAPSRSPLTASSLLMDGHSTSDDDAVDGPSYSRPHASKEPARRPQPAPHVPAQAQQPGSGLGSGGGGGGGGGMDGGNGYVGQRGAARPGRDGGEEPAARMGGGAGPGAASGGGLGMEGLDGLYQQLQMVPLHAREAVLVKLLEVQRMAAAAAASAGPPERNGLRDYGAGPAGPGPGLQGLVPGRGAEAHGGMRGLGPAPGLYDDGGGAWRGEYGAAAGAGGGLRMGGFHESDGGAGAAARRLPQGVGMGMGGGRGPGPEDYCDAIGAMMGNGSKLPGIKASGGGGGGLDSFGRPVAHGGADGWGGMEAAHRRAAEVGGGRGAGGGRGDGSMDVRRGDELGNGDVRGYGEGGQSNQMRRNIHLLCDMLGGPSMEPPPALRAGGRKRRDDDAAGSGALDGGPAHHRARHGP